MRKSIVFIILLTLLSVAVVPCRAVDYDDLSAVVMVGNTGEMSYNQNPHKRLPMASTTKIMTAIIAIENLPDLDILVSVPKEACGIEGSSIYLYENEIISAEALLYGLLLDSGNDAAVALAISVGESLDSFVSMMNSKAGELGLENTHYMNPHGLSVDGHYTSAFDLATLMRYCMQNETFKKIVSTQNISFEMSDGTTRYFSNHNKLLRRYDHCIGGKTGYTKVSGRCLVTCAEKDGVQLICVTLGAYDDFNIHTNFYEQYFGQYKMYDVNEDEVYSIDIVGSLIPYVQAVPNGRLSIPLLKPGDINNITKNVETYGVVYAPIEEGQIVGSITYYYNGEFVQSFELISINDAESVKNTSIISRLLEFIRSLFVKE